jgi:hypothetical protein
MKKLTVLVFFEVVQSLMVMLIKFVMIVKCLILFLLLHLLMTLVLKWKTAAIIVGLLVCLLLLVRGMLAEEARFVNGSEKKRTQIVPRRMNKMNVLVIMEKQKFRRG